ncbi:MAG: hypothetical protein EAX86_06160 [Candidatus Heimdallarchaeota archaeon]|nr:hypothetical protein [Candidatus Heimdallarchaeota archaeon]
MVTNKFPNEYIKPEFNLDYKPKYQIFSELMKRRINKVLLVSSYYDNFILEEDGRLSDQIFEEFHNLNLRTMPVITRVSTPRDALEALKTHSFDLVITMKRLGGDIDPFSFGQNIKKIQDIPVVLLLTNTPNVLSLPDKSKQQGIDRIFVWNGDSTVFVAIIKHLEDSFNVDHDTNVGLVRVIIVVEDSIRFYSLFLPVLYSELVKQTHRLITDGINDYHNLLQMRVRPKILLAENYEEAMCLYQKYKNYVIGVISDVRFTIEGKLDQEAGIKFIQDVKKSNPTLPCALQSSEPRNEAKAKVLNAFFINKKSRRLLKNLRTFMLRYLGFGVFKFRLEDGTIVGRARNIHELYEAISEVPGESLVYHGSHDHFSGWLMNRAEFSIAQKLKPVKVSEFDSSEELRKFLLNAINEILIEKTGGVVHDFSRDTFHPSIRFTRLRPGSLGGKGRGIAFLQFLLNAFLLADDLATEFSIRIPKTIVIGTDEFDGFMEDNEELYDIALSDASDDAIKTAFKNAHLRQGLKEDLSFILKTLTGPLSIRSSSLLEDSQYQPFAGVFETYMLPNNQNMEIRLNLLCCAIKLVYASSFLKRAKSYAEAIGGSIEESKMAVVIQQVVGKKRKNNLSYPSFSGVGTSYNYYPISYLEPSDRVAFLAIGLGKTIVDGGLSLRFCPKYPELNYHSVDQLLDNTQKSFFAIDLSSTAADIYEGEYSFLVKESVFDVEEEVLFEIADTYDYNDKTLKPGYTGEGTPVITFNKQLKYNKVPLAPLINKILALGEQAMGCSVEIEFAGNFQQDPSKPTTFYLLQIRPFTEMDDNTLEESKELERDKLVVYSSQASGNMVIKDIKDIVYVKPDNFDKLRTPEIVDQLDAFNKKLSDQNAPYVLLGFGRWGTFDRFLGIPVKWNNISSAKVIIEAGLPDFQIEHSQGSHFFQNITTANIGYLYTKFNSEEDLIDWDWLKQPNLMIDETEFVRHIRSNNSFYIRIDGKKRQGSIVKPSTL